MEPHDIQIPAGCLVAEMCVIVDERVVGAEFVTVVVAVVVAAVAAAAAAAVVVVVVVDSLSCVSIC